MNPYQIRGAMHRQGATCKGLQRRVRNLYLSAVPDPRVRGRVRYALPILLRALVTALVTRAPSLRAVEQRTAQLGGRQPRWLNLPRRIADNTFGRLLPRLSVTALVACMHRLVKAEHRRGNLTPTVLPVGTLAPT